MANLETRFEQLMRVLPSVELIDQIELSIEDRQHKIADYFGPGRSIIFEQKSITQDQSSRIQKEIESHLGKEYYPHFYGERDLEIVLEAFPNADEIRLRIYSQITKLLESYLSNASRQIASTAQLFDISSFTGVLIILNDNVVILSPEIVAKRVQQRLREKRPDGTFRFAEISYVLLISDTHLYEGRVPVSVVIEGPSSQCDRWGGSDYLDYLLHSWAAYNGGELGTLSIDDGVLDNLVERAKPLPDKMTRSDERRDWYRNNRYMRDWSDEKVLRAGATHMESIKPYIMKGGKSIPSDQLGEMMLAFGDFIEESNFRGLDLREMKLK